MTYLEVISTDAVPRLINNAGTHCLTFNASTIQIKTHNYKIEIYNDNHEELVKLANFVSIGQVFILPDPQVINETKSPLDPGLMRVIQKYDGDTKILEPGNHLAIRRISNAIEKILNTVQPSTTDPYLRYLNKWPFINGHTLFSLTRIGASHKEERHHFRPGGIIDHVEEMVKLQFAVQSEMSLNEECAGVVCVWHDMGKTCVTDAKNPTEVIADYTQANDHDRYTLWLHGIAHAEYPENIEIETSSELRSLTSALGNIHNNRIYNRILDDARKYDQQSAIFDQQHKSSENGFQQISEKEKN